MGTKQNPGKFDCYTRAADDEPMFILLARDPLAESLVRQWANHQPLPIDDKTAEAFACADAMRDWRIKNVLAP